MAKECFCGCGRTVPRFPLGMRAINTRGGQVVERLSWAEDEGARGRRSLRVWFEQGEEIIGLLAATMHGEIDPRTVDERPIREWQAAGRDLLRHQQENVARFGRWASEE